MVGSRGLCTSFTLKAVERFAMLDISENDKVKHENENESQDEYHFVGNQMQAF